MRAAQTCSENMKLRLILVVILAVLLGGLTELIIFFLSRDYKDLAILAYPLPLGFLFITSSDDYVNLTGALQFLAEGVALAVPETRIVRFKVLSCIVLVHLVFWAIMRQY